MTGCERNHDYNIGTPEDRISPYWLIRKEVKKKYPEADNRIIDEAAKQTINWSFNIMELTGRAYGDKENLIIPKKMLAILREKHEL